MAPEPATLLVPGPKLMAQESRALTPPREATACAVQEWSHLMPVHRITLTPPLNEFGIPMAECPVPGAPNGCGHPRVCPAVTVQKQEKPISTG
jgi:hypothetical protein